MNDTEMKPTEMRMKARKFLYKHLGYTENILEILLSRRFPDSDEDYWLQWLKRFKKIDCTTQMDNETFKIYIEGLKEIRGMK